MCTKASSYIKQIKFEIDHINMQLFIWKVGKQTAIFYVNNQWMFLESKTYCPW